MSLFAIAIAIHGIAAVVGVGLVGAIPIVASSARCSNVASTVLPPLFRASRIGLGLAMLSGVLVELGAGGAFHSAGWFRASFALLVFVFFAHRRAQAAVSKAIDDATLHRVARWGWAMCGSIAVITLLMMTKPF